MPQAEAVGGSISKLRERLQAGPLLCAEGYLFELERRGHVQAGPFVPSVVLEDPEAVLQLHREFVRAGTDVVEALTYYAHRAQLAIVGQEDALERLNRDAIALARRAADETRALVAGNISNTNVYRPGDADAERRVRAMFDEQVGWAADEGVDFVIGETFSWLGEAKIALEAIQATGLPAVITLAIHQRPETREGLDVSRACRQLEEGGAEVVGLNCMRGPATMWPLLAQIRRQVSGPMAALPVPYRTTNEHPTFHTLEDPGCDCLPGGRVFPTALDPFTCNRYEAARFATEAHALGVEYIGLCCGAAPHHVRAMAEALGRKVPASRHSPDMSRHAYFGERDVAHPENRDFSKQL